MIRRIKRTTKIRNLEWPLQAHIRHIQGPFALLHGGLSDQIDQDEDVLKALLKVGKATQKSLKKRAVDISLAGVHELEACDIFNAGYGSKLQADGVPRLSAALMDGKKQRMSSVSNVLALHHPSHIAQKLLDTSDRNLSGLGADRFAFAHGLRPQSVETKKRVEEWQSKKSGRTGTVGCVALDANNFTAACTSTGGRGFEAPGRVSDSCTPAGNFANMHGAVSCTGVGEEILDAAVAASIGIRLEDGMSLENAVTKVVSQNLKCNFGLIALDRTGNATVHATQGTLAFVLVTPDKIYTGLFSDDWKNL